MHSNFQRDPYKILAREKDQFTQKSKLSPVIYAQKLTYVGRQETSILMFIVHFYNSNLAVAGLNYIGNILSSQPLSQIKHLLIVLDYSNYLPIYPAFLCLGS